MKRFLLFFLTVVLIFSTVTLPASAALPAEEETVQPTAIGDQTTYHICFREDGRMLSGAGTAGTPYTNQYIAGNTSMQWFLN